MSDVFKNLFSAVEKDKVLPKHKIAKSQTQLKRKRSTYAIICMIKIAWMYLIVLIFSIVSYLFYGMLITEDMHPTLAFAGAMVGLMFGGILALIVYFKLFPTKEFRKSVEAFKSNEGEQRNKDFS